MKIKENKKTGKKELVHPPKAQVLAYDKFVKEMIEPVLTNENTSFFQPRVRGFRAKLVPHRGQTPCDVCENAQYNRLCTWSRRCVPMLFLTLMQLSNIDKENLLTQGAGSCSVPIAKRTKAKRKTRGATTAGRK